MLLSVDGTMSSYIMHLDKLKSHVMRSMRVHRPTCISFYKRWICVIERSFHDSQKVNYIPQVYILSLTMHNAYRIDPPSHDRDSPCMHQEAAIGGSRGVQYMHCMLRKYIMVKIRGGKTVD